MSEETSSGQAITSRQYENTAILSNAIQLGCNVIRNIAGNEVADGFGGERISSDELHDTMAAKVNAYLPNPTGGKV